MNYYTERLAEFGTDVKALGWGSEESQHLRFNVLMEIADLTGQTVLDYGCGFGDLCTLLHKSNYIGYDNNLEVLNIARQKYPIELFVDRPVEADYVLASGVFNLDANGFSNLRDLWALCRKGVGANFTSGLAENRTQKIAYADPSEVLRFCACLTKKFTLRHDYKENDFCVYLFR